MPTSDKLISYLKDQLPESGIFNYFDFIKHVLYAPNIGYYTRPYNRIGKNSQSDFYTNTNLAPVFDSLIEASVANLLGKKNLKNFSFVEIGAEPGKNLFQNGDAKFKKIISIGNDEPINIPSQSMVFSNELLDAQPFHRIIFKDGRWLERGVRIFDNSLEEILLDKLSEPVSGIIDQLPTNCANGYQLDLPIGSNLLLKKIAEQNWSGLLLFFDYGKTWNELTEFTPQGTARTYHKHQMGDDLLAQPGELDITCHICWDWLEKILQENNFSSIKLERQESFFMNYAKNAIGDIFNNSEDASKIQTLKELIHPTYMGHKFQVLWGLRVL